MLIDREPASASRARHWVTQSALDAGLPLDDAGVVELLAGELIANAFTHGPPGGEVIIEIRSDPDRFGVFVFDDSAMPPVLQDAPVDAPGGRGIAIVDALSADWGWTPMGTSSKAVWFFLDLGRPVVAGSPLVAGSAGLRQTTRLTTTRRSGRVGARE